MVNPSQSNTQRKRAIVFWLFVIGSVPLIAGVIGYASGYRFDRQSGMLTENAILSLDTTPAGAMVLLNEALQTERTPYMETLAPGEYTVRIEKEGYLAWEKTLTLEHGKSAIFPDIILYLQKPPQEVPEQTPIAQQHFRVLTAEEVAIYQTQGYTNTDPLRILDGPRTILVDPSNDTTWLLTTATALDSAVRLGTAVLDAEWNAEETELLYINEFELWSYTLSTGESLLWRRQQIPLIDATWHPGGGYVFFSDGEGMSAIEYDSRGTRQRWEMTNISNAKNLLSEEKYLYFTVEDQPFVLTLFE